MISSEKLKTCIQQFLKMEAAGGILLLIFSAFALIFANSPLRDYYFSFLNSPVVIQVGEIVEIHKPLLMWVNDGFMAVFFVLVGLEVKREMLVGAISSYQRAIFPAIAACGGMIIPALVYWFINQGVPDYHGGWAIPMATDIAFAVGVLVLLGNRVPFALKVFLLALAIIDDLGAIIVIALFFSHDLSTRALILASIAIVGLILLNRFKVSNLIAYVVVGVILWVSVLKSGVHATLAGVIIGFCVPLKAKNNREPLVEMEHAIAPWSSFLILPLFAFCNAGIPLSGLGMEALTSPLTLGVTFGLLLGKPVGVFAFSYLSVKLRIAKLPEGINFKQIFAVAVLCGIGFTMSMFLASLAFGGGDGHLTAYARLGILFGSSLSAVIGYWLLFVTTKEQA
ncbi:Na+/H+ antiporter NhaA [Canicola haemoglobinophilus]|uniref:Na(+)/H(+) antiporter NhaA n=1 Tax=Canicola haemoglobinophilus TaxID=733 RepID=A0A1V4B0P0_9PAST|nr:Na+/H+ antiporter NhaA [Canicola haemoglobinophilus]OOS00083.1 Na+/H+ antiporter NhaA [Canicola haemoglobinophilus]STO53750.1 pH-dependent sodium/proton antiporter [Canicola haemoglobinophilus]STO60819.1 pH-dependent sodium/proton antiporter [Canicola haemoglobinophilus]STO68283.1 pH-dependent sodium/proton antiporter [Canicola haemoglobinophilus]